MRRRNANWFAGLILLLGSGLVEAQQFLPKDRAVPSASKQFVVTTSLPRMVQSTITETVTSSTNHITLTPGRMVLLAEKVKTHFLRELRVTDQWRGHIRIHLDPLARNVSPTALQRTLYSDGWQFQVTLPERAPGDAIVRLLVDALLDEMTHRYTHREIDIPLWLRVGLTETILAAHGSDIIMQSNSAIVRDQLGFDPLRDTRSVLQQMKPFTYTDLSIPTRQQLKGAGWIAFRSSAHLMTTELLHQHGRPGPMYTFIRRLSKHRNSQFAFMETFMFKAMNPDPKNPGEFKPPNQTMLDVEKWWMMTLTNFRSRDSLGQWSPLMSMSQLEEILTINVDQPGIRPMRVQQMLAAMSTVDQKKYLEQIRERLPVLQRHSPPKMGRLTFDYYKAIDRYYRQRGLQRSAETLSQSPPPMDALAKQTNVVLDRLDTIMADLHVSVKNDETYGKTVITPRPVTRRGQPFSVVPPPVNVLPKRP